VVNGLTLNAQLTVKVSVFSRLQSFLNRPSGFCGTASRRCPSSRLVEVRKHPLALMLRRPAGSRRNERGLRRSASPVYRFHSCAWPMDRSFISEPVRAGRHGRVAPEVCGSIRQSESGSDPGCVSCRGMGLVECARKCVQREFRENPSCRHPFRLPCIPPSCIPLASIRYDFSWGPHLCGASQVRVSTVMSSSCPKA
jgi:hypothetical protein